MNPESFEKLPYTSRRELIDLKTICKNFIDQNPHLIENNASSLNLYLFTDVKEKFTFNIRAVNFDESKKQNVYTIDYRPSSLHKLSGETYNCYLDTLNVHMNKWSDIVLKLEQVTEEYYNPFKKFYESEFVEFFTNNDSDADINPFDIKRQEILFYFLTYAQKCLDNNSELNSAEIAQIKLSINDLQSQIPNITKKETTRKLSRIAEKVKKISNKLFHEIFDVLKKEVIKKILYEGAAKVPDAYTNIQNWLQHF